MAERGPGRIIRPMLNVTRAEVLTYLSGVSNDSERTFVNDSSNQSASILRNRVRAELMPMLELNYAPGLRGRLVQFASEMRALDGFVSTAARHEIQANLTKDGLDISRFALLHPALQSEVIRQYIRQVSGNLRKIDRAHIDAVKNLCLDGPPNGILDIPGLRLMREYGMLRVVSERRLSVPFVVTLKEGRIEIPEGKFAFEMTTRPRRSTSSPASKFEALFDAAEAEGNLVVRNFRAGDRIAPLGMDGHRKVQDILVDNKVAMGKRASFPIVELDGVIAWLPGLVRGGVGLVTEATEKVLHIRAIESSSGRVNMMR
jgi:tRNA(Ile)-lysidine synthase